MAISIQKEYRNGFNPKCIDCYDSIDSIDSTYSYKLDDNPVCHDVLSPVVLVATKLPAGWELDHVMGCTSRPESWPETMNEAFNGLWTKHTSGCLYKIVRGDEVGLIWQRDGRILDTADWDQHNYVLIRQIPIDIADELAKRLS